MKLIITQVVHTTHEVDVDQLPEELKDHIAEGLKKTPEEFNESHFKEWFCNLDSGEYEDLETCYSVESRHYVIQTGRAIVEV